MREIKSSVVTNTVAELCFKANVYLREDVKKALKQRVQQEEKEVCKRMLNCLLKNSEIAEKRSLPICQDTGMVVVFIEIGKDVKLNLSNLKEAVNKGVAKSYKENYFRKSVVDGPFSRNNTDDNTPAIVHYDFSDRKGCKISVLVKGFGAENKSKLYMLNPTASKDEVVKKVTEVVETAGPDGCPPYILGVGIGGTMDKAALMAKKSLLNDITEENEETDISRLEKNIKQSVNSLGIGIMGLGGESTCLGVNILEYPTHIAGLPLAVNINCHALRSAEKVI